MTKDSVDSPVEEYDLVVLGSGEGSKYLAWTLAKEGQRVAVIEQHLFGVGVDAGHRREQGRYLGAIAQEIADRPGDLRCRQRCGRDLVQQRLEQMVVAAVDQRDADRRASQVKRRLPSQQEHYSQREGGVVLRPSGGVRHHDLWLYRQHGQGDGPQADDGEESGRDSCPQL